MRVMIVALLSGLASGDGRMYDEKWNAYVREMNEARDAYRPCQFENCTCYQSQISADLLPFSSGINMEMIEVAKAFGVHYQIIAGRLYRQHKCIFSSRCRGVEHFLLAIAGDLPDMDIVLNEHDHPQVPSQAPSIPIFSFSKSSDYKDILFPAWSFSQGGPAISLYPQGIGSWDSLSERGASISWKTKKAIGFFRGSRTNAARDPLILLSRSRPDLIEANYTKNQAWRTRKDTLDAEPAPETSFEDHCVYKYLFNFRGVAASFRHRHLFLCASTVFHVGHEWIEFYYKQLMPWIHYVPVDESLEDLESLLEFAKHEDHLMEEIAQRGRDFIWTRLRMQDVQCYWNELLKQYGELLQYRVVADPSLLAVQSPPLTTRP